MLSRNSIIARLLPRGRARRTPTWAMTGALALAVAAVLALPLSPLASLVGPSASAATLAPLPARWPSAALQLGLMDSPGGAPGLRASLPVGFRYQYLAGGANTGSGWATWNPNGQFATYYIQESVQHNFTPTFTYYMIYQSKPGSSSESDAVATNLSNTSTMTAYYNDLKLFFQRAGAFPGTTVILHVEPDMWGYIQQRSSGDNAATMPVKVAATGLPELAGLPDNAAGLARAIVKLRDQYAPNVLLGYHVSIWGTGTDIQWSKPPDATVDALAGRAAAFYASLGAAFDLTVAEFSDRDAGYKQYVYGDGGASWMNPADFARHARFLAGYGAAARQRLVLWQIPLGNTKMRAMNNTTGHYQDNRPEWLLDDPTRAHLDTYLQAGVIAFLFGGGAGGVTCACDAQGDGVTNPAPIGGNTLTSLSADDDGGFFRQKVRDYYTAGPMPLPGGGTVPPPPPTPTTPPVTTATATAAPVSPTATQPPTAPSFTTGATVAPSPVAAGGSATITASVRSATAMSALVDVEVYDAGGTKVHQQFLDNQAFTAGQTRAFPLTWAIPANAATGSYRVAIGVFSTGWGTVYTWNHAAATVAVTAPSASPTATPTKPPATATATLTKPPATATSAPATATRTPTPRPTNTPTPRPTTTPTPRPTNTPAPPTATPAALTFATSARVSAGSVKVGQAATITASVTTNRATTGLVDIEVHDSAGNKVYQRFYDNQTFAAGVRRDFTAAWTPTKAGTYTVKIGVFKAGWGVLYAWNGGATTITVTR